MAENKRYSLFKKIARGGMAEIFLGKHIGEDGFQRVCCIKRILPHYAQDAEFIEMFRDEAHICKSLQHANIVRVEGFEEVEGSYAIIMEFINGGDLRSLLSACESKGVQLSVPMALYLVAEAARGLHFAHSKKDEVSGKPLGIVHRDISPQNILISFEGEVKVTDFGIANADNKSGETKTGIVKGKYAYMSPEQITAKSVDARTDVFALSVVLWEMLAMRRLFQGENEVITIQQVRDCEIDRDLRLLNLDVDDELYAIVLKGLEKMPADRHASAAEMETRLRRYVNARYSDFTLSELSDFIKNLLSERLLELQQELKTMLSQEAAPSFSGVVPSEQKTLINTFGQELQDPSVVAPLDAVSPPQFTLKGGTHSRLSSAASGLKSAAPPSPIASANSANRAEPMAARSDAARPSGQASFKAGSRSGQRSATEANRPSRLLPLLSGLVVLALLASGVYFLKANGFFSSSSASLTLHTSPGAVKVSFAGQALFDRKYVKTPLVLALSQKKGFYTLTSANLGSEQIEFAGDAVNTFTFSRTGFKEEVLRFQGRKIIGDEKYIVLEKTVDMAPTRIRLQGTSKSLWVEVDDGVVRDKISPTEVYEAKDLTFGDAHTLYAFPYGPENQKAAFTCRFVPRSQDWTAPYMVVVQVDQQKCTYPPR